MVREIAAAIALFGGRFLTQLTAEGDEVARRSAAWGACLAGVAVPGAASRNNWSRTAGFDGSELRVGTSFGEGGSERSFQGGCR